MNHKSSKTKSKNIYGPGDCFPFLYNSTFIHNVLVPVRPVDWENWIQQGVFKTEKNTTTTLLLLSALNKCAYRTKLTNLEK